MKSRLHLRRCANCVQGWKWGKLCQEVKEMKIHIYRKTKKEQKEDAVVCRSGTTGCQQAAAPPMRVKRQCGALPENVFPASPENDISS